MTSCAAGLCQARRIVALAAMGNEDRDPHREVKLKRPSAPGMVCGGPRVEHDQNVATRTNRVQLVPGQSFHDGRAEPLSADHMDKFSGRATSLVLRREVADAAFGVRRDATPARTDACTSGNRQARTKSVSQNERGPEKGDRHLLPERPSGCFAQKVPVTFFPESRIAI